jgi:hypothetical protein
MKTFLVVKGKYKCKTKIHNPNKNHRKKESWRIYRILQEEAEINLLFQIKLEKCEKSQKNLEVTKDCLYFI